VLDTKRARKRLGITQAEFARVLGVSFPTIQRWEYGMCNPSALQADIIARINKGTRIIERKEKETGESIAEILRAEVVGSSISVGLYKLLGIILEKE